LVFPLLGESYRFSLFSAMPDTQAKLIVIGAGLPRTGTLSLSKALEILLGGECYHMIPFMDKGNAYDIKHWKDALVIKKFF